MGLTPASANDHLGTSSSITSGESKESPAPPRSRPTESMSPATDGSAAGTRRGNPNESGRVTPRLARLRDATTAFFKRLSGGEMHLVHVCGHPQGVGRDR